MGEPTRFYLDDLKVGQRFASGTRTLDEKEIITFARAYDPQPFHTDAALAEKSMFGGLIASGWHTSALTMSMLLEALPLGSGTIGVGGSVEWPNPVRPHDVLKLAGEVLEIKPSRSQPDRGIVTVRADTTNQRGEPVQILTAKLLVLRKPV